MNLTSVSNGLDTLRNRARPTDLKNPGLLNLSADLLSTCLDDVVDTSSLSLETSDDLLLGMPLMNHDDLQSQEPHLPSWGSCYS